MPAGSADLMSGLSHSRFRTVAGRHPLIRKGEKVYQVINVREVLWLGIERCELPGRPQGYPFEVLDVRSTTADGTGQYVYGRVLDADTGKPTGEDWMILVPVNQPRAWRRPVHEHRPRHAAAEPLTWPDLAADRPYLDPVGVGAYRGYPDSPDVGETPTYSSGL